MVIKEKTALATDQDFNTSSMAKAPTEMSATMIVT